MQKAAALERAGNWAGVVETLRPASETLPRLGLLRLARAYGAQKDYLNQVSALEMLANKGGRDYYALSLLGDAYMLKAEADDPATRNKDRESATQDYRDAIDANHDYLPAYEGLLAALESLHDRFEERSLATDMLKRFGNKPPYLAKLCQLYSIESFIDKAIEVCKQAIAADSKLPDNHVYLAQSLREKQQEAQAEKILKMAAQRFPSSELAQWAAGQMAFDHKSFASSYKFFAQGTKANPGAARSWLGAGKAALENDQMSDSAEAFARACELDPQTLSDYRKAAAQLRQRKRDEWSARFEANEPRCGTKQKNRRP
jgi:tetratricopeptide (TPR) repeat protein